MFVTFLSLFLSARLYDDLGLLVADKNGDSGMDSGSAIVGGASGLTLAAGSASATSSSARSGSRRPSDSKMLGERLLVGSVDRARAWSQALESESEAKKTDDYCEELFRALHLQYIAVNLPYPLRRS